MTGTSISIEMEVRNHEEMTVPVPMIAQELAPLLASFATCFTAPTFESFRWLLSGWILCIGRHTVTGVVRAAGAVGVKHHSSFHRFFRLARWSVDNVGLCLLKLVMKASPKGEPILIAVDDTLGRHWGRKIHGASMHRDPLLSTRAKTVHRWGHVWVIVAVVLRVPSWDKSFALPVLCRLYRAEKVCQKRGEPFFKKPELAKQLIEVLAKALPRHVIYVLGDNGYTNGSVIKNLPDNAHYLGRGRIDAALYAAPKKPSGRGRPRIRGKRVASPKQRADENVGWSSLTVNAYGREHTIEVKVFDAIWYRVSRGRMMRFVLVRGWPGREQDDVICCTDLSLDARTIVERFCRRWSIEVTFHETKDKLGFEQPQNRTERAVERTAPMALWAFTLTVVWYLTLDKRLKSAQLPQYPWYEKTEPAFSDMLAALRRETWRQNVLDPLPLTPKSRKCVETLLHEVAYAA
ncbi:MAG: transposase [Proteobacteria bacterium]|nr:transposase [Pseudomonadota bacterium]